MATMRQPRPTTNPTINTTNSGTGASSGQKVITETFIPRSNESNIPNHGRTPPMTNNVRPNIKHNLPNLSTVRTVQFNTAPPDQSRITPVKSKIIVSNYTFTSLVSLQWLRSFFLL